jgi:hypothetical protein
VPRGGVVDFQDGVQAQGVRAGCRLGGSTTRV